MFIAFDFFLLLSIRSRKQIVSRAHSKTVLQKNIQLERDNSRVGKQLNDLKVQQKQLKDQLQTLMDKFQKEIEEGQTIHNIQEQQKKIINE